MLRRPPIPTLFRQIPLAVRHYTPLTTSGDSTYKHVVRHPYFLPRNTRGSLPVYTDVRNAGSRYVVLIKNVEGDTNALAEDLTETLFDRTSEEAARMKIQIMRSKHLVLTGGRWKNDVVRWLLHKGF